MAKNLQPENVVALIGNPNVGKSTVFNSLTGLKQHTGNWAGKTVDSCRGHFNYKNEKFILVDTPGTYSLFAKSKDEQVARDLICFGDSDLTIIVCDATCLERNLNLVLQTMEVVKNVIICINLINEAERKGIHIDLEKLKSLLNVPIVFANAIKGDGLEELKEEIFNSYKNKNIDYSYIVKYNDEIENAVNKIYPYVEKFVDKDISIRWVCLQLIQNNSYILHSLENYLGKEIDEDLKNIVQDEISKINYNISDEITSKIVMTAEGICKDTITFDNEKYNQRDLKIDKILTSKLTGIPIMLSLLAVVFWITIVGSNYPSEFLSNLFFGLEKHIISIFTFFNIPYDVQSFFVGGVYKVLSWVISVMLPPMAIFFPLFTILEDSGYLSRVAFNLDKAFKNCNTCGKQALTMAMGFGCNCAGITGCRIIDSTRERIIAILTNNFVPCNGRFPILISVISMFLIGATTGFFNSALSAMLLTSVIFLGIFMTFLMSKLLSKTILKGLPSSFTLELPPYRKPQVAQVIVSSIFNRTLGVLGRAILAAIPAGAIIWVMANVNFDGTSLLNHFTIFLEPFAKIMGLDGVILMAFILGFPANEIVIPIMIMAYINSNTLIEIDNIHQLKELLLDNGWTLNTAICTMIFTLFHFPCATACLTVKKETNSYKWTFIAFILPTIIGVLICSFVTLVFNIFT